MSEARAKSPATFGSVLKGEARDALIFSASNFLNKFAAFFLLPFYWKRLTPQDYGLIAIVAMIGQFQSMVGNLAMDGGLTRFFYEWPAHERARGLGALWTWNWISHAVWAAAFLFGMPLIFPWLFPGVEFSREIFLGLLGASLANFFALPFAAIRIQRLPRLFALCNLSNFAAMSGFGIWFVLYRNGGVHGYMLSTVCGGAVMSAIGCAVMLNFCKPALSFPGLKECLRYSAHIVPSQLIDGIGAMLDRYLLNYFSNLATLGLYSVCMKFTDIIGALHSSLKMAYGPFLMKTVAEGGPRGRELVAKVTPAYTLAYLVAVLGLGLFIGDFVKVVNEPAYFPVVNWVPLVLGFSLINTLYVYYTPGIILSKRTSLLWIPSAINMGVLAAAAFPLIGRYGLGGLVATRYLGATLFFMGNLYLSQRVFPFPHRWRTLAGLFGAAMLAFLAGRLADGLPSPWNVPPKAAILAAFAVASFAYLLKTGGAQTPLPSFLRRFIPAGKPGIPT